MDAPWIAAPENFLHMAALALGAVCYLKLLRVVAAREAETAPETDEALLGRMALERETSEYRLFHAAAADWNIGARRIDADFDEFVTRGAMPHYVRDFVRRCRPADPPCRHGRDSCPPLGPAPIH